MGAAAAAAVIIRKEKDLVAHFQSAGAIAAGAAKSPDELGVHERLAWERLVHRAVIREAAPGRYYLDEPSWVALRHTRRRMALILGILMIALAAALWIVTVRVAGRV
jgi:hypothetical protein